MNDNVEYLNLDEVEPSVKKVLTIKGVQYDFKQPSVGEFLTEMKRLRSLKTKFGDDADEFDVIEEMVKSQKNSVKNAFPTVPDDVLDELNTSQLDAIRVFIQKEVAKENAEAKDEAGNG
jgi:hypothetical protein